mmetsp:Transcript_108827/g.314246  ORF Transcript_108827/g.314246 Transcript_108827/m.314246 type:complete len:249 (-) Transcript_108827:1350-2096(-)
MAVATPVVAIRTTISVELGVWLPMPLAKGRTGVTAGRQTLAPADVRTPRRIGRTAKEILAASMRPIGGAPRMAITAPDGTARGAPFRNSTTVEESMRSQLVAIAGAATMWTIGAWTFQIGPTPTGTRARSMGSLCGATARATPESVGTRNGARSRTSAGTTRLQRTHVVYAAAASCRHCQCNQVMFSASLGVGVLVRRHGESAQPLVAHPGTCRDARCRTRCAKRQNSAFAVPWIGRPCKRSSARTTR